MSGRNVSQIIADAGFIAGFFAELVKRVENQQGTDFDLHRLVTPEGEEALDKIAEIIVQDGRAARQARQSGFLEKLGAVEVPAMNGTRHHIGDDHYLDIPSYIQGARGEKIANITGLTRHFNYNSEPEVKEHETAYYRLLQSATGCSIIDRFGGSEAVENTLQELFYLIEKKPEVLDRQNRNLFFINGTELQNGFNGPPMRRYDIIRLCMVSVYWKEGKNYWDMFVDVAEPGEEKKQILYEIGTRIFAYNR